MRVRIFYASSQNSVYKAHPSSSTIIVHRYGIYAAYLNSIELSGDDASAGPVVIARIQRKRAKQNNNSVPMNKKWEAQADVEKDRPLWTTADAAPHSFEAVGSLQT